MKFALIFFTFLPLSVICSHWESQLYEDLLYWYQRNVRPVQNASETVTVLFGASLIRLIELDEVNQVLTSNLWLEMQWVDNSLKWNPADYDGVYKLHVPSTELWTPDIVLYNNAAGNPQITIMADALVFYDGTVIWKPPAIYNSFCEIDIEFFPYDEQYCEMKFGAWTYTGTFLDIEQIIVNQEEGLSTRCPGGNENCAGYLKTGMDLSNYQLNAEWDLIFVESRRHSMLYPGCCGAERYVDITLLLNLRRKPLFFTVNLVIPCMLFAMLTTFVFYIPFKGHKITFAISILVTLTIFFLVLIDLIPPTSLVIPLIAKYLLFTIILVAVSIFVSVITLNIYHRSGTTHTMPHWVRWLFLRKLPSKLCIKPPESDESEDELAAAALLSRRSSSGSHTRFDAFASAHTLRRMSQSRQPSPHYTNVQQYANTQLRLSQLAALRGMHPDVIRRMIDNISFIAEHYRAQEAEDKISEDWSYVAMVIDRLFLIVFTIVNIFGTVVIILQAPSLYDNRPEVTITDAYKPLAIDTGAAGLNDTV